MRRLNWFETKSDHDSGLHYRLIIESKSFAGSYLVNGRLIDCGLGYDSIFRSEIYSRETQGLEDMAGWFRREAERLIRDGFPLLTLPNRLLSLNLADVDSCREDVPCKDSDEESIDRMIGSLTEAILSGNDLGITIAMSDPFYCPPTHGQLDLFG